MADTPCRWWVTMMSVLPSAFSMNVFSSARSVAGSRPTVGSSSSMTGVSCKSTRASAMRWRSPPEKRIPASSTMVSSPSGRRSTRLDRPTCASTSRISSSVAAGLPMRRFSRSVMLKRYVCCWITPMQRATPSPKLLVGTPFSVTLPDAGARSPRMREASVLLPEPLRPRMATFWPCGMVRLTPSSTARAEPG